MAKAFQIRSVETLACDAGWRNYHFVKIMTEDGIVGWSEYDEGFGAPGVTAAIERLAKLARGRQAAIGALLVRTLVQGRKASQLAIRRQEAAIVFSRFKGSRARYVAALATRGATPDVGRAVALLNGTLESVTGDRLVVRTADPAELNARLVAGGVRVRLLQPERHTLEDTVLALTSDSSDKVVAVDRIGSGPT